MKRSKKSMMRLTAVSVTFGIAASLLAACGGESDKGSDGPAKVRMATFGANNFSWMAEFAIAKGFFEQNNIKIEREVLKAAPIAVAALASKSVDVIEASPLTTMPLMASGQTMTMISGEAKNPFVLLTRKGLDVGDTFPGVMRNLKGKKLGVSALGSSGYYLSKAFVEEAGMKESDVSFVAVGSGPEGNAALDSGKIDALMTVYPYVAAALKSGSQQDLDLTRESTEDKGYPEALSQFFGAPYIGSFTNASWAKSNKETVKNFQLSLMEASCFINNPSNLSEFAAFVKELGGVPDDITDVDEFVKNSISFSAAYPREMAELWTTFAANTAEVKNPPKVDEWYGEGIAQDDAEVESMVKAAGGSCTLPTQK